MEEKKQLSREEKIEKISKFTAEQLLNSFVLLLQNFNPIDYDMCETYELVKENILERMKKGEENYVKEI